MWMLAWVPYSITHGLNPFFTDYLLAPHGMADGRRARCGRRPSAADHPRDPLHHGVHRRARRHPDRGIEVARGHAPAAPRADRLRFRSRRVRTNRCVSAVVPLLRAAP